MGVRLKESVQELEEYQAHSGELEAELETELEQSTGRCTELRHQVAKLATENEDLKVGACYFLFFHAATSAEGSVVGVAIFQ